jgi:hypothetical protein
VPPTTLKNRGGLTASPPLVAGDTAKLRGTPKDLDTKRPPETGDVAGLTTQGMVTARDMMLFTGGNGQSAAKSFAGTASRPPAWMLFTGQMVVGGCPRASA